jgi:hypothetical protein
MSPGVRTIPAPMEFPIAAETPNQTPRTCSRRPRPRAPRGVGETALVAGTPDVLDNVESQGSTQSSAIIAATR